MGEIKRFVSDSPALNCEHEEAKVLHFSLFPEPFEMFDDGESLIVFEKKAYGMVWRQCKTCETKSWATLQMPSELPAWAK